FIWPPETETPKEPVTTKNDARDGRWAESPTVTPGYVEDFHRRPKARQNAGVAGGGCRTRTYEGLASGFTVRPLCRSGHSPVLEQMSGGRNRPAFAEAGLMLRRRPACQLETRRRSDGASAPRQPKASPEIGTPAREEVAKDPVCRNRIEDRYARRHVRGSAGDQRQPADFRRSQAKKTLPGLNRFMGSNEALTRRMRSIATAPCSSSIYSRFFWPTPCSPVQVPPMAMARRARRWAKASAASISALLSRSMRGVT